jgi:hypothetical protein
MNNFDPKSMATADRVANFMMELCEKYHKRWNNVPLDTIPYGDLAYGAALMDWYKNGRPKDAWFSYAPGEIPCPYLIEFRVEIGKEFGLRILTHEESLIEEKNHNRILNVKVHDWGLN